MDKKIIIIFVATTLLLIGGGVVVMTRQPNAAKVEKIASSKFETDHNNYDWGQILYERGVVKHIFEIKNTGGSDLQLANIKTSCMCTTAKIALPSGQSPIFKMHQVSDWKGVLAAGETGRVEVVFDPAYHGPTGVGPIERVVSFESSDPNQPYIEFNVKGVVIKT